MPSVPCLGTSGHAATPPPLLVYFHMTVLGYQVSFSGVSNHTTGSRRASTINHNYQRKWQSNQKQNERVQEMMMEIQSVARSGVNHHHSAIYDKIICLSNQIKCVIDTTKSKERLSNKHVANIYVNDAHNAVQRLFCDLFCSFFYRISYKFDLQKKKKTKEKFMFKYQIERLNMVK